MHVFNESILETVKSLRKENFDYIIDLHNNFRSLLIKLCLLKPGRSVKKLNIQKWLMVNFKINTLPSVHIVDRYLETIKKLGASNDGKGLDYFIPKKDILDFSILPSSHQKEFLGFVIGAKHFTKQLSVDKIISVCKKIDMPIVLLGGQEDYGKGEIIRITLGEKIYNACGKFTINQTASLINKATSIISNDTGLMHIAAALKKKVISIWGNTIPEFGMYPYYGIGSNLQPAIVEVRKLSCRPCTKIGFAKCPKGHFNCINLIKEEEIISKL